MPGRPATAGSRGPVPREPSLSPSGYRISVRRKAELKMAERFTDTSGLQAVIDLAVTEFLDRMHAAPGFTAAVINAENNVQRRAGVRQVQPTTE